MFNPETNLQPGQIWDFLGTFYNNLSLDEKARIETYWKSLSNGIVTQFFNLYQENTAQFLSLAEGWQESEGWELDICYKDELDLNRVNTRKEFLEKPSNLTASYPTTSIDGDKKSYSYKVTAINAQGETLPGKDLSIIVDSLKVFSTDNITLQWDDVQGASGYKVYGRTPGNYKFIAQTTNSEYTDINVALGTSTPPIRNTAVKSYLYDLTDVDFYLTIPKLVPFAGDDLVEGTEYELVEGNKIRFFLPLTIDSDNTQSKIGNTYTLTGGIKILPSLEHVYLPAYGTSMNRVITSGYYKPHLKDWSTWDNEEKHKARAKHLKDLVWGYSVLTRRDPSISTLKQSMALAYDYPFSYEDGVVTDITGRYVTISGLNSYTYDLGDGVQPLVGVSGQVNRFDILASGINFYDYYSHQSMIESLNSGLANPIDPAFLIKLESTSTYLPDPKLQENFKKITIPAGLITL